MLNRKFTVHNRWYYIERVSALRIQRLCIKNSTDPNLKNISLLTTDFI